MRHWFCGLPSQQKNGIGRRCRSATDGWGAMVFGGVVAGTDPVQMKTRCGRASRMIDVRAGRARSCRNFSRWFLTARRKWRKKLAKTNFLSDPIRQKAYQPFGNLHLDFGDQTNIEDYRRELDLNAGMSRVTYRANGVTFTREAFASYPDDVIVLRVAADKPGSVSFTLTMTIVRRRIQRRRRSRRTRCH